MNIIITGATGRLGSSLVSTAIAEGHKVTVLSRDPAQASQVFPGVPCIGIDDFSQACCNAQRVIHLATKNSDQVGEDGSFFQANLDFAKNIYERSQRLSTPLFINVSSVHALPLGPSSAYGRSKRAFAEWLEDQASETHVTIYLPYILDASDTGLRKIIGMLPRALREVTYQFMAALKPAICKSEFERQVLSENQRTLILTNSVFDNPFYKVLNRILDLAFAFVVLILGIIPFCIISLFIRAETSAAALFLQDRVGLNGTVFKLIKLRTMYKNTQQTGTHNVPETQITKSGKWLRALKIDELPQAWNIVRNQLSLVGPRPSLPVQSELNSARKRRGIDRVKPGITGLAQINGIDMSNPEK
ncbi:MAG: sugar transferase, partial [Pseudomonadota bacterium]